MKSKDFIASGLLGLPRGYPCQPANPWISLLRGYWGYLGATLANQQILGFHCFGATGVLGATLANQQILGFHCFGATGASSGPPLPTIAMHSLLCNLCYAIFETQSLQCNLCYAIVASLLCN